MTKTINNKVLITGSNGFVGDALYKNLKLSGYEVIGSVRNNSRSISIQDQIIIESLDLNTDWKDALQGCNTVIHLAGRAHMLNDDAVDPLLEFRITNTEGTLNLAEQAVKYGVTRFIFMSSIGVNGSSTLDTPFRYDDPISPHSSYAISKHEAEIGLREIAKKSNLEVVIIRSPAIYGKNAPGNFGMIEKFINKGFPLPVGLINNKRSLIALDNIISFIELCIGHQNAANETFLVSDNQDLSTIEIVKLMGSFVGKRPRIIKLPLILLRVIFASLGKNKAGISLISNLQLDINPSLELLEWTPPFNPRDLLETLD